MTRLAVLVLAALLAIASPARVDAQTPVAANADHAAMLAHPDPRLAAPLASILADGDLVTLVFVRELPEPSDATKKYSTTWFDMFRLENGRIAEHWDPAVKR